MSNKILFIAALGLLGVSGSAHAATLDVTLGNLNTNISYASSATGFTPNIHLNSPAPATLTLNNNAQIIDPRHSDPSNFLNLQGSLLDNNFLAVLGTGNPGLATLSLAANTVNFGFTWGSIDAFNTLTVKDSRGVNYTITGSDILAQIGNPPAGKQNTQTDVSFSDAFGKIVSAQFGSTDNAFEAGNFSETSATPCAEFSDSIRHRFAGLGRFCLQTPAG